MRAAHHPQIKSIKRQIKAKELEHDLVYYAFRGVSQRLSRERGVTEESQAAEVAGSSNASVASGASGATDDNDAVAPAGTSSGAAAGTGTGAGAGAGAGSGGGGGVEDADSLPADMPLTWTGRHKQVQSHSNVMLFVCLLVDPRIVVAACTNPATVSQAPGGFWDS